MISKEIIDQYLPTIGIEIHVQLKSKTKIFSGASNDARDQEPNTVVTPICFGMPGVLPALNEEVVSLAIKAGIALESEIANYSTFDRKHYFYPDLPKGYQITQFAQPIVGKGEIEVIVDGDPVMIGITRAHLEEDAGKSTHPAGKDYSLVDLNRAGTPLLEIVSEPDMRTSKEARAYAREVYFRMKYAQVSDVDLFHGNMRFDVNTSVAKKNTKELGTRTEVKNLNSFRSVEKAVDYEIKRQVELLEKGEKIKQQTLGWDEAKQKTVPQRGKEEAHDYRYFPEPDLPPVIVRPEQIKKTESGMRRLPKQIREELREAGVEADTVEVLLEYPDFIDRIFAEKDNGANESDLKRITDWFANVIIKLIQDQEGIDTGQLFNDAGRLTKLSRMVEADEISATSAKVILDKKLQDFGDPVGAAEELGLKQESDEDTISKIVDDVIANNGSAADDVRAGEAKAIGFLTGQVMQKSKGSANPKIVQKLLREKLN